MNTTSIQNKIDFAIVINVNNANPNGDPSGNNRPRQFGNLGEISDVCLKRKIRNRLMAMGENIFVQSNDNNKDGYQSLKSRFDCEEHGLGTFVKELTAQEKANKKDATFPAKAKAALSQAACAKWLDTRAFGQVLTFKTIDAAGNSLAIRGPVTITHALSLEPIEIVRTSITKSVNIEGDGVKKDSSTMGEKQTVSSGVYVAYGSVSPQLAECTGFSDADADKIKSALVSLFVGDESSARPAGSMDVAHVAWWTHPNQEGAVSSRKTQLAFQDAIANDGSVDASKLKDFAQKHSIQLELISDI